MLRKCLNLLLAMKANLTLKREFATLSGTIMVMAVSQRSAINAWEMFYGSLAVSPYS